jgi:hypothetical protein
VMFPPVETAIGAHSAQTQIRISGRSGSDSDLLLEALLSIRVYPIPRISRMSIENFNNCQSDQKWTFVDVTNSRYQ